MQNMRKLFSGIFLFFCMLFLFPMLIFAETQEKGIDIIFALDVSDSMKKTDSEQYLQSTASLLIDMLSKESRAGFVAFSDKVENEFYLSSMNSSAEKANMKKIVSALEYSSDTGTDIVLALESAMQLLENASGSKNEKVILLITDGHIGEPRDQIEKMKELEIQAKEAGISVYTALLGEIESNTVDPLVNLVEKTEGNIDTIKEAEDMLQLAVGILKASSSYPLALESANNGTGISYTVSVPEKNIAEMNILISGKMEEDFSALQLLNPMGSDVQQMEYVKIESADRYTMIKIQDPEPGDWKIDYQEKKEKLQIQVMLRYNLLLNMYPLAEEDGFVTVRMLLFQNEKVVKDDKTYRNLKSEVYVVKEDGTEDAYPLNYENGYFTGKIPVKKEETVWLLGHVEGNNISLDSDRITYTISGEVIIEKEQIPERITCRLSFDKTAEKEIDLERFWEKRNPEKEALFYEATVMDENIAIARIEGNTLFLRGVSQGKTEMFVGISDSSGNAKTIAVPIVVTSPSLWWLIISSMVSAVLISIISFYIIIAKTPKRLRGSLTYIVREDGIRYIRNVENEVELRHFGKQVVLSHLLTDHVLISGEWRKIRIKGVKDGIVIENRSKELMLEDWNGKSIRRMMLFPGHECRIRGMNVTVEIIYENSGYCS